MLGGLEFHSQVEKVKNKRWKGKVKKRKVGGRKGAKLISEFEFFLIFASLRLPSS